MVAREEGILQKAQESPECPRGTAPRAAGAALGPAEPGLAQPHKPGGKCSGLKPGRRNGGGGGGGTPGANPGGGIPKGAVKAGGWSAPTTGGPDGWGGPAPKSGTLMDHSVVNRSTMEQTSLLQPVMAGREVKREPGADGTGLG